MDEVANSIWIIILAAGHSVRMGVPKGLLPIRGQSLVSFKKWIKAQYDQDFFHKDLPSFHFFLDKVRGTGSKKDSMLYAVSEKAMNTGLPVAVILGKARKEEEEFSHGLSLEVVDTDREGSELSDSLRSAIKFSMRKRAEAVVILLGDQPDIDPTIIKKIVQTYRNQRSPIVQAQYTDGPGHPVLFDKYLFAELLKMKGDQGARAILKANKSHIKWVRTNTPSPVDLDTPEDYINYVHRQF